MLLNTLLSVLSIWPAHLVQEPLDDTAIASEIARGASLGHCAVILSTLQCWFHAASIKNDGSFHVSASRGRQC